MIGDFSQLPAVFAAIGLVLYRSAVDPRPQVLVTAGEREVLAHVDLAGTETRVGWGPVIGEGWRTRKVENRRGTQTRTVIPRLALGDVVLHDVPAVVGGDEELVIGVAALDGVEAAILPSTGEIRFARAGSGLVEAVGEPVGVARQSRRPWWHLGARVFGDGSSLVVPAEPGPVHLRTDRRHTTVPAGEGPHHAGRPTTRLELALGDWTPPPTVARVSSAVLDPTPGWVGALGVDALFALDLAVAPDRPAVAWAEADALRWTDPGPWLAEQAILDDERATALWRVGELGRALEASEAALEEEGCFSWLVLGMRRLRAGEPDPFPPLETAMGRWEAWASLDREDRDRIRAGKRPRVEAPDAFAQPDSCAQSTGRWLLARLAHGEDPVAVAEDAAAYEDGHDPWTPLAEGLAWLRADRPARAEVPLRRAWARGGDREAWLALAMALQSRDEVDGAAALVERVHWEDPRPLSTAWLAASLGLEPVAGPLADEARLARAVVDAVSDPSVDREALRSRVVHARQRSADAAWTLAAHRVLLRLDGEDTTELDAALERWRARSPDPWTAGILDPDPDVSAHSLAAARARFPELPWPEPPGRDISLRGKPETPSSIEGPDEHAPGDP